MADIRLDVPLLEAAAAAYDADGSVGPRLGECLVDCSVGMAVDANVLIFERIKEELKTEKSIIHAFDIGYTKAKITVLDANITTLIAAVILFAFGSGPVKGFAITLGIGIITTLYSAYFLARHMTSMIVLKKKEGEINL